MSIGRGSTLNSVITNAIRVGAAVVLDLFFAAVLAAQGPDTSEKWQRLPLPEGVNKFGDVALMPDGELFLASENRLWIRSPFGDGNGWEQVPGIALGPSEPIQSIESCRGPSGTVLLVASESRLLAVKFGLDAKNPLPWATFKYRFQVATIAEHVQDPIAHLYGFGNESSADAEKHAVHAYLATSTSRVVPIVARDGRLQLGNPLQLDQGAGTAMWSAGQRGWGVVWKYATSRLFLLSPDGELSGKPIDLGLLAAPEPEFQNQVHITAVWRDHNRELLFVGTNYGLLVADVEQGTCKLQGKFGRVSDFVFKSVQRIGSTAGRLWVVTNDPDVLERVKAPLWMEKTVGRRCRTKEECRRMKFFVPAEGDGPPRVSNVVQVADDMLLGEGENHELWEWAPGRWHLLPESQTDLRNFDLGQTRNEGRFPCVIGNLLNDGLWYRKPADDIFWTTHAASKFGHSVRRLVPDPSGQGVWSIADGKSVAVEFGWLTFETPHGLLHGQLDVGGPERFSVRSLSIDLPDGAQRWPISRHGGCLLPSGANFVYAESGVQQAVLWKPSPNIRLEQMIPGGASSLTAWLAIRSENGKPKQVVRVDLPETFKVGDEPELSIEATEIQCASESPTVLVPDSDGNVWFAFQSGNDKSKARWTGLRIHSISDKSDQTRDFGEAPPEEPPVYLYLTPAQGLLSQHDLLFTARGVFGLPRTDDPLAPNGNRPAEPWNRLFDDKSGVRFRSVRRSKLIAPFEPARVGLLLTEQENPDTHERTAGPVCQFSVANPAASLVKLEEQAPAKIEEKASATRFSQWLPEILTRPGLAFRASQNGKDPPSAPMATMSRPDGGQLKYWNVLIPSMTEATEVVPITSETVSAEPQVDLAAAEGALVALHRLPPTDIWDRIFAPAVPVAIEIERASAEPERYLADVQFPKNLPYTAHRATVVLRPNYNRWWSTAYSQMQLRVSEDQSPIAFDASGRASGPLVPGRKYAFDLNTVDPLTGTSLGLAPVPFEVEAAPVRESRTRIILTVIGFAVLLTILSIVIILAVSARMRRATEALLTGRVWNVVPAYCHLEGRLAETDGKLGLRAHPSGRPDAAEEITAAGGAAATWLDGRFAPMLDSAANDDDVTTVLIEAESQLLVDPPQPAAVRQQQPSERRIITGYVPSRYRVPDRPRGEFLVASVRLDGSSGLEAGNVRQTVRSAGFRFLEGKATNPPMKQLLDGLRRAHVVLVFSPVAAAEIQDALSLIEKDGLRVLQCRLLIFCNVAGEASADHETRSRLIKLASLGMHVLAVPPLKRAQEFVDSLVAILFRRPGRGNDSLAHAISTALGVVESDEESVLERGLWLYGDPSIRVAKIPQYDVFLSHRHVDRELGVRWLRLFLGARHFAWRRYGTQSRYLGPLQVCLDQEGFGPRELGKTIPESIAASRHLVVCCSEDAAKSHWIRREIRYFLRDRSDNNVVLCDVGTYSLTAPSAAARSFIQELEQQIGKRDFLRLDFRQLPNSSSERDRRNRQVELRINGLKLRRALSR
jgi:TIR domain